MKCLIVDPIEESFVVGLRKMGIEVLYQPEIASEKVPEVIALYQGLVLRSKLKINRKFLDAAVGLKFLARAGSGLDGIDLQALHERGIHLFSAPEGNRDAVAEHTLGLMLCLLNKISASDAKIKSGIWDRDAGRGLEISGKTIGIIGYGHMGSALAQRLVGFGCRVLSYDRQGKNDHNAESVSLQYLKNQAQIVSFHIPLDSQNKNLCNKEYLSGFAHDIFLINTSRGEILPLQDLVWALETGKVKGAALDVLENEKLETLSEEQKILFKKLSLAENVVMTPHVAGWTVESYKKISQVLLLKIAKWIGEKPS